MKTTPERVALSTASLMTGGLLGAAVIGRNFVWAAVAGVCCIVLGGLYGAARE